MKIFYTYILYSISKGKYYYGSTGDLEKRIKAHNMGKVRSTKSGRPWKLHYIEEYETKTEAIKQELFFKNVNGYNYLKERGIK